MVSPEGEDTLAGGTKRPDGGDVLAMFFAVQVRDRKHLAQVIRSLKRVPDVKRAARTRT